MLEEINGETFKEYLKTLTDDLYNNLALSGYDKANMSPAVIKVNEMMLLTTAKRFWEIKNLIDNIPNSLEKAIPLIKGKEEVAIPGENHKG